MSRTIAFSKYHALENDFIVIESNQTALSKREWGKIAFEACHRKTGIGADGLIVVRPNKKTSKQFDARFDIFNQDGSWAEKSGNGVRIAAYHLFRLKPTKKQWRLQTATSVDEVDIRLERNKSTVSGLLGVASFATKSLPMRTKLPFMIGQTLKIGKQQVPVTCLSVGNPHCVVHVDHFDFDWPALGNAIEHSIYFPNRTNVEFVRIMNRKKIEVREWERGVGITGSSGTGAAAAVCASVMLGLTDRSCEVRFLPGSLHVEWRNVDNRVRLSGPVEFICEGTLTI